jgi:hypothetical protein
MPVPRPCRGVIDKHMGVEARQRGDMKPLILQRGAPRLIGLSAVVIATAIAVASCGGSGGDASIASAESKAPPDAADASCNSRVNNTPEKLLQCVTLAGVGGPQTEIRRGA